MMAGLKWGETFVLIVIRSILNGLGGMSGTKNEVVNNALDVVKLC